MGLDVSAVEELVDPRGVVAQRTATAVDARIVAWKHWNVALFSNSKANADILLEEVAQHLSRSLPELSFTRVKKPSAGVAADQNLLASLPAVSDAVVLASAD